MSSISSINQNSLGSPPPSNNPSNNPDPYSNDLPSWFTNAVSGSGGNVLALMERMVNWMAAHPTNLNAPLVFLQFLTNVLNDPNVTPSQIQEIKTLLNSSDLANNNGHTLLEQIVNMAYQAYFYIQSNDLYNATNGDDPSITLSQLTQYLQNLGISLAPLKSGGLDTYINGLINNLPGWLSSQQSTGNIPVTNTALQNALTSIEDNWGDYTLQWQDLNDWENQAFQDIFGNSGSSNAFASVTAEEELITENIQDDLGGYASVVALLNTMAATLGQLTSMWQSDKGNFQGSSAQQFIQTVIALKNRIDHDPRTQGLRSNFDSQINQFLTPTILNLYNQGNYGQLASALNALNGSGIVTAALKGATASVTSQSQLVQTQITQSTNDMNAFISQIHSTLNDWLSLLKTISSNIAKVQ